MLAMLDYDLKGKDHKQLVQAMTLTRGSFHSADLKVRFAPWFLVPTGTLSGFRAALLRRRPVLQRDAFLLLPLGDQTLGRSWHGNPSVRRWLRDHGVVRPDEDEERRHRVVGVSYTLHLAERQDYGKLIGSIELMFPDCCKPLHAMFFLYTDKSLRRILDLISAEMPSAYWQQHEALAVEVPSDTKGFQLGLEQDHQDWFGRHGISMN